MSKFCLLSVVLSSSLLSPALLSAAQTSSLNPPLVFEPNCGQAAATVLWLARAPGYQLYITTEGATIVVPAHARQKNTISLLPASFSSGNHLAKMPFNDLPTGVDVVKMQLSGNRPWSAIEGLMPTGGVSNYLLGNDPAQWHAGVPQYARVRVAGVYPGIDLVFYAQGKQLEYDFVVAPGADPKQIRINFAGAASTHLDGKGGELLVSTASGSILRHLKPKIYQSLSKSGMNVAGSYQVLDNGSIGFALANYDVRRTLVIDPVVSFTRFLAGSDSDVGSAIAVDQSGNSYVTGQTFSTNYPTLSAFQTNQPSVDAFVTKLSPAGTIIFSTYLGGKDADFADAIALDSGGGIYVVGSTNSADFPSRDHRKDAGPKGFDAFLTRFNPSGATISYTNFIGGSATEFGFAVAVDAMDAVYVAGTTFSSDFPVWKANQPLFGGKQDAFLVKYLPGGYRLDYATYIGGSSDDEAYGVAGDKLGNAYVTGYTSSYDFKTVGASQGYPAGASSTAFVSMFQPIGTAQFSVYFGGGSDVGYDIAVQDVGSVFITGATSSFNLPVSSGAYQHAKPSPGTLASAFATKIVDPGLFVFSTYLGGTNGDTIARAISLHSNGAIYVAGNTSSTTFPGAPRLTPNPTAGFVVKFQPFLNALDYTVFLGAAINGIAIIEPPGLFTTGWRFTGGHNPQNSDAFVVRLDEK